MRKRVRQHIDSSCGLALGLKSTAVPVIVVVASVLISYFAASAGAPAERPRSTWDFCACRRLGGRHAFDARDHTCDGCLRPGCRIMPRRPCRNDGSAAGGCGNAQMLLIPSGIRRRLPGEALRSAVLRGRTALAPHCGLHGRSRQIPGAVDLSIMNPPLLMGLLW